jgi:hypothetical protein
MASRYDDSDVGTRNDRENNNTKYIAMDTIINRRGAFLVRGEFSPVKMPYASTRTLMAKIACRGFIGGDNVL